MRQPLPRLHQALAASAGDVAACAAVVAAYAGSVAAHAGVAAASAAVIAGSAGATAACAAAVAASGRTTVAAAAGIAARGYSNKDLEGMVRFDEVMKYVISLLILLSVLSNQKLRPPKEQVESRFYPRDTIEIELNDIQAPAYVYQFIKSINSADSFDTETISLDAFKKLNNQVDIILYSHYTGTSSTTAVATFKNGSWFEERLIREENDADLSLGHYESTTFETPDTINFTVIEETERVIDTSLIDSRGFIKNGMSIEDSETHIDTVTTRYRVFEQGNIIQTNL